jgi:hypothetical protein
MEQIVTDCESFHEVVGEHKYGDFLLLSGYLFVLFAIPKHEILHINLFLKGHLLSEGQRERLDYRQPE